MANEPIETRRARDLPELSDNIGALPPDSVGVDPSGPQAPRRPPGVIVAAAAAAVPPRLS